jgi:hypothetical protein
MGNVVWTTAGALLGSINAGRYVGVDILDMYIDEWGSYVSLFFCLVIQTFTHLHSSTPIVTYPTVTRTHSLYTNI